MKGIKDRFGVLSRIMFIIMPLLHIILILSNLYLIPLQVIGNDSSYSTFAACFAVAIPVILSYIGIRILNRTWAYGLLALVVTGICCLFSYVLGIISIALFFFRFFSRLEHSISVLDSPHYAGLAAFIIPYAAGGVYGLVLMQAYAVYSAFIYLLITALYRQIRKVNEYINLNHEMSDFPGIRLRQNLMKFNFAAFVLAAAIGFAGIFFGYSFHEIKLEENTSVSVPSVQASDSVQYSGGEMQEFSLEEIAPEYTGIIDWNLIGTIATVLTVIVSVPLIFYGLYRISILFRNQPVTRENDVIESIEKAEDNISGQSDFGFGLKKYFRSFSKVRRKYIRAVRSRKYTPQAWETPAEIECSAGLADTELHRSYEKERYSSDKK